MTRSRLSLLLLLLAGFTGAQESRERRQQGPSGRGPGAAGPVKGTDAFELELRRLANEFRKDPIEERDDASAALEELVRKNLWEARERIEAILAQESDPEVLGRFQEALRRVPPLQIRAVLTGPAERGKSLPLRVSIKNTSGEKLMVVRPVEGSDAGKRAPRYEARIEKGPPTAQEPPPRPRNDQSQERLAALSEQDFVKLSPGEEFNPFGEGNSGHRLLKEWRPSESGDYVVNLVCDYRSDSWEEWNGEPGQQGPSEGIEAVAPPRPGGNDALPAPRRVEPLRAFLRRVPKMRLTATTHFRVD